MLQKEFQQRKAGTLPLSGASAAKPQSIHTSTVPFHSRISPGSQGLPPWWRAPPKRKDGY